MLLKATTSNTAPTAHLAEERAVGECLARAPQGPTDVHHVGPSTLMDTQVLRTVPPTLETSEPAVRVAGIGPVKSQVELGSDHYLLQAVQPFQGSNLQKIFVFHNFCYVFMFIITTFGENLKEKFISASFKMFVTKKWKSKSLSNSRDVYPDPPLEYFYRYFKIQIFKTVNISS